MLPAIGSTMRQATSPARDSNTLRTAAGSLNGTTSVNDARASGMPGLPGIPRVITPEPACTSSESTWPW